MSNWYEAHAGVRWDPTLTPEGRRGVIREYAKAYPDIRVFVETGTADGGTTNALYDAFYHLYTIEISPSLYKSAKAFLAKHHNVQCLLGDSTSVIPDILRRVNDSCVWWLDGHYCGDPTGRGVKDTPIREELELVLNDPHPHVVLIDDSRLFGNDPAYPSVDWVRNLATTRDIRYAFSYVDDIMRIVPV